ncbi:DUF820 [Desulfonema magnum]|uniref:DUF820 n=1 Tax=Desulfonema magnum TaxID=45655 RepID=A0A975GS18_9BACT|nr:DUF820 [Desulfonema magnum]
MAMVFVILAGAMAQAQEASVPPLVNYQGMLTDADGKPLTGTKKIEFNLYDAATGGTKFWGPQIFSSVPLVNGMFNVILGEKDEEKRLITDAFESSGRYLGIKVNDGDELFPRQQILSTPYAIRAEKAGKILQVVHNDGHGDSEIIIDSPLNPAEKRRNLMLTRAKRKTFTTDEYHQMIEAGILREGDRLELIQGEIIQMAAIGSNHASCVGRLTHLFSANFAENAIVWVQNPVCLGKHSEPEPDISLLKPQPDFYASRHPRPEDVLLIVEVADTSLEDDREIKLPLYAKAGIREVWIVNLKASCVEVSTSPSGHKYLNVRVFHRDSVLSLGIFPDAKILVDDIIGQSYPLTAM